MYVVAGFLNEFFPFSRCLIFPFDEIKGSAWDWPLCHCVRCIPANWHAAFLETSPIREIQQLQQPHVIFAVAWLLFNQIGRCLNRLVDVEADHFFSPMTEPIDAFGAK
jgi:hypothetical protein